MIEIFEDHSVDVSLLNKNGVILDLGSLAFSFSLKIKKYVNTVIAVDPNPEIIYVPDNIIFENKAIVINKQDKIKYNIFDINTANSLLTNKKDAFIYKNFVEVDTITIKEIMFKYNIQQFELIKIDIEGYEYELLKNIDWKISKQYSIEFHDFRNFNPYYPNDKIYYEELFKTLTQYCDIIKHRKTHSFAFDIGKGTNYWDSLFILKKEYWI